MRRLDKKIVSNTVYTIGSALLMNGVLQLIINPVLNRIMGDDQMGFMLYIMGLAAIVCPSVGQALNTSRLVVRRKYDVSNGDYNVLILLLGGIGTIITLVIAKSSLRHVPDYIFTIVLLMFTAFRYYGDVEYRLSLKYKNYFHYYAVLTGGYLLGLILYLVTDNWFLVYITGEMGALLYVAFTGQIFYPYFKTTKYFTKALQRGGFLVISYLINNISLNIDRIVLKNMINNEAVTQYYVASLIGKTLVILVAPINTILISYLTKKEDNIKKKQYLVLTGIGCVVSILFFICSSIATPIFVKIFYGADMYQSVASILILVNITQILNMFSSYLLMIVLSFTEEKLQMILQSVYMLVMVILVVAGTYKYGIMGFTISALIANALRALIVFFLGFCKVKAAISENTME